jgi:hypothetical protein
MDDTTDILPRASAVPSVGLRIAVLQRRFRFAALLSHLTGRTLEQAWRVFAPLPAPDGSWGVPESTGTIGGEAARRRTIPQHI